MAADVVNPWLIRNRNITNKYLKYFGICNSYSYYVLGIVSDQLNKKIWSAIYITQPYVQFSIGKENFMFTI